MALHTAVTYRRTHRSVRARHFSGIAENYRVPPHVVREDPWAGRIISCERKKSYMGCVKRKPAFCQWENKGADQLVHRQVQSIYFLKIEFQASSHLLWLYSPVCVGHGQKCQRQVLLRHGLHAKKQNIIMGLLYKRNKY